MIYLKNKFLIFLFLNFNNIYLKNKNYKQEKKLALLSIIILLFCYNKNNINKYFKYKKETLEKNDYPEKNDFENIFDNSEKEEFIIDITNNSFLKRRKRLDARFNDIMNRVIS